MGLTGKNIPFEKSFIEFYLKEKKIEESVELKMKNEKEKTSVWTFIVPKRAKEGFTSLKIVNLIDNSKIIMENCIYYLNENAGRNENENSTSSGGSSISRNRMG